MTFCIVCVYFCRLWKCLQTGVCTEDGEVHCSIRKWSRDTDETLHHSSSYCLIRTRCCCGLFIISDPRAARASRERPKDTEDLILVKFVLLVSVYKTKADFQKLQKHHQKMWWSFYLKWLTVLLLQGPTILWSSWRKEPCSSTVLNQFSGLAHYKSNKSMHVLVNSV